MQLSDERTDEIAKNHVELVIRMLDEYRAERENPETRTAIVLAARTFFEVLLLEAGIGNAERRHIESRFRLESLAVTAAHTIRKIMREHPI